LEKYRKKVRGKGAPKKKKEMSEKKRKLKAAKAANRGVEPYVQAVL
jgi:hypothetical protein